MRFAARTIVIACLAAAVLVPAATAADRMWVGFQDDPMFRWDPQRMEAMDRARSNEARIVRTVVDWSRVAPDRPASPTDSVRLGVQVRGHRRARAERAAARHGGADHALGDAEVGERRPVAAGRAPEHGRLPELRPRDRVAVLRPVHRATRTSGSSRSGTSPTSRRSCARSSTTGAGSSRRGTYARLAKAGYTGIKQGNRSALVAIGETSSHGRDHPKKGLTDTVAPATFMKGVAAQGEEARA